MSESESESENEYDSKLIASLPPLVLADAVKLALWTTESESLGYELVYRDEELLTFRRKKKHDTTTTPRT